MHSPMPRKGASVVDLQKLRVDLTENAEYRILPPQLGDRLHLALDELEQLRAKARALVAALPKCPGDVPDWKCGIPATMVFTGADGDESYSCPEHAFMGSEEPCAWAAPLRDLLALLGQELNQ